MYLDHTLVTVIGYDLSYLEFFGTVFNLASVWLVIKRHVLTWPIGISGSVVFAVLFYDVRLYSDLVAQLYFVATGFYGWWVWVRPRHGGHPNSITWLSPRQMAAAGAVAVLG